GVYRGVGYGVGIKNICFSEGFDDYSTARVRLEVIAGEPVALVHTAGAEVGQGLITLEAQIVRTELGVERVISHPSDNNVGSSGSSSASRQSYMTGGAVMTACRAIVDELFVLARKKFDVHGFMRLEGGKVVENNGAVVAAIADVLGDDVIDLTREYHHRPTTA
ncbi:molybdopterin cofactor-binding domain-containing protein, partial [Nocardia cerradoensis]|uniref:molybdopterin cofactor-binding domain-containing protein n=1 Tax=Nocardia cerradoensis TaxID=85688 RepID=UPI0011AEA999